MRSISTCPLQHDALLRAYDGPGNYTDCYVTRANRIIELREFVRAFYSTPLFAIERSILKVAVSKPSSLGDIDALADGTSKTFAAWSVEAREPDQLLLADYRGRTRSWLRCSPVQLGVTEGTDLFFGSAVVKVESDRPGPDSSGLVFRALLPFHKLYSRGLLASAKQNLGE